MKLSLIGAFLSSLGIALMMIPSIIKVAEQKKLFDIPHSRRAHETSTPTLGGVSFFAGFLFLRARARASQGLGEREHKN